MDPNEERRGAGPDTGGPPLVARAGPASPGPAERRVGLALLGAALAGGACLRVWLALHDDGVYWPDEVFQSLEPAHRLAFGYGMVAWEFAIGARSWALPGLIAGLFKLCEWAHLLEPRAYLTVTRLTFCGLGVATAFGSFRLARTYRASVMAAAAGASLFALAAPAIYFSHRAMSETASALPVVLGFAFALEVSPRRWQGWLGPCLLGLSVLLRLQNALFCAALVAVLLCRRQWLRALQATMVLCAWALLFGLLDRLTWGEWFHSALVYLRFNLVQGGAVRWGSAGFGYYARVLWTSMPLPTIAAAVLGGVAAWRARGLWAVALLFVLAHSWTEHKELRFIYPALPLLFALAGVGVDEAARRLGRSPRGRRLWGRALAGACALCGVLSGAAYRSLTWGELGAYETVKPGESAYDDSGPVNRLLLAGRELPDLCGVKILDIDLAWTGAFTYLHRRVQLYSNFGPPRETQLYNYAITHGKPGWPGEVVLEDHNWMLVRLARPPCVRDVAYDWQLH